MASKYSFRGVADMSQHDKAINKSAAEVYKYQKQVEKTNKQIDSLNKTVDGAANSFNSLFSSLKGGNFSSAFDSIKSLKDDFANAGKSAEGLGLSIGKVAGSVGLVTAGLVALEALDAAVSKVSELVSESVKLAESAEGVKHAFLAIGNESLLQGLREATHGTVNDFELMKAAVQANDFKIPLDQLGKYLEFAQLKAQQTGQEVDYLVNSIVTGLGRQSVQILDNLGLSAAELKNKMAEGKSMAEAVGEVIDNQLAAAGEHFETTAERAQQRLVALQNKEIELGEALLPIKDAWGEIEAEGTNALMEITKEVIKLIGNSDDLNTAVLNIKDGIQAAANVTKGAIKYTKTAVVWAKEFLAALLPVVNALRSMKTLYDGITGKSSQPKAIRMTNANDNGAEAKAAMQAELDKRKPKVSGGGGKTPKVKTGRSGGKTTPKESAKDKAIRTGTASFEKGISNLKDEGIKVPLTYVPTVPIEAVKAELDKANSITNTYEQDRANEISKLWNSALNIQAQFDSGNLLEEEARAKIDAINKMLKDAGVSGYELDTSKIDKAKNAFKGLTNTIGSVGDAFSAMGEAFEEPAFNILGTIAQAIASIMLSYAEAAESPAVTSTGWGWIAFAAAGLATALTAVASIKSATSGFAEGGIFGGTTSIGDYNLARVNKGEMILNGTQQSHLFNAINSGALNDGNNDLTVKWKIKGSDLEGTLYNYRKIKSKTRI